MGTGVNLVLTCLFTGCADPQRPKGSNPDWEMRPQVDQLMPLLLSIRDAQVIVFHDELDDDDITKALVSLDFEAGRRVTFERWPTPTGNIYRDRWRVYRSYLSNLPVEPRWLWCVDGTDVKMLRPPWQDMGDGLLYTCSEQNRLSLPWIANNHPSARQFVRRNRNRTVLNAGLCGGGPDTVYGFLESMIDHYFGDADREGDMTDMGAFNRCAWENYWDRLMYGTAVHTVFTAYESDNGVSWWSHR